MMEEKISGADAAQARIGVAGGAGETVTIAGRYEVRCFDADGSLLWEDVAENKVTTFGVNFILDNALAGSAYTAAEYLGIIGAASYVSAPVAGDTMASHSGWAETTNYTQSTRPGASWSAASGGAKALSGAVTFTANASETWKGCFLTTNSTKGGTSGTLISAGLFSGGDQPVVSTNNVQVSYTLTITPS